MSKTREKCGNYIVEVPFSGTAKVEMSLPLGLSAEEIQKRAQEILDKGEGKIDNLVTHVRTVSAGQFSGFGITPPGKHWRRPHFIYLGEQIFWIDDCGEECETVEEYLADFIPIHTGARVSFNENEKRKVTCASVISHDISNSSVTVFDTSYGVISTYIGNIAKPTGTPELKECLVLYPEKPWMNLTTHTTGTIDYFGKLHTYKGTICPTKVAPIKGLVVNFGKVRKVLTGDNVQNYLETTHTDKIEIRNITPVLENGEFLIENI